MKRTALVALGASLVAIFAAALASAAPATKGRLIVSSPVTNVGAASAIHLTSILAPNTFRTTIYVPAGYRAPGDLGAVGNSVGKGHVFVRQEDGSRATLNGELSVVNASQYADTGCTGDVATRHKVWVLDASQPSGTMRVTLPIFVATHRSNPNLPATAAYSLQYCTGNRGLNIDEVDLDLVRMFVNPSARGMSTWRAVYDPATSDGKGAQTSGGVLVASSVPIGLHTSLRATPVRSNPRRIALSGSVLAAKTPLAGVRVQLYVGHSSRLALRRPKATVRTKADGSYRVTLQLGPGTWYARARASSPYQDVTAAGGCASVDGTGLSTGGCVDATLSSFIQTSKPLKRIVR